MKSVTVTVTHPFEYKGRSVQPGDVLEVSPVHAAALKYQGRARFGGIMTAAITPDESTQARAVDTGSPSDEPIATPRRRRTYRRRDLTAEE